MPRSRTPTAKPPKSDGRVHRSVVTREKIVSALTALIYEGHLSPTAEQVAQRADIGLRTVFRHFDDMDSLYREINTELENQFLPMQSVRLTGYSNSFGLLKQTTKNSVACLTLKI